MECILKFSGQMLRVEIGFNNNIVSFNIKYNR